MSKRKIYRYVIIAVITALSYCVFFQQAQAGGFDPVAAVSGEAARLGFSQRDQYSLLSFGNSQALVQVNHGGAKYIAVVDKLPDGEWNASYSYKLNH